MFHHKEGSFLLCVFFIGKLTDALNGFWTQPYPLPFLKCWLSFQSNWESTSNQHMLEKGQGEKE